MNYSKRYLTLKSAGGESVTVCIETAGRTSTIKPVGKTLKDADFFLVSDGIKTEKYAVNGVIGADIDLSGEVYVCLVEEENRYFARVGNKYLSGEKLLNEYQKLSFAQEKSTEKETTGLQNYDDELIAEENYFLKESADGKGFDDKNAQIKGSGERHEKDAGGEPHAYQNDADRRPRQEQNEGRPERAGGEQREEAFYERGRREREIGNIESLIAANKSEAALSKIYPFGKFARVENNGSSFIVGKIEFEGRLYYCVGTDGSRKRFTAENPEKVFFVPGSIFRNTDEGYFLSFLTEDCSDYIVRRF